MAVRQRRYLVEKVDPRPRPDDATLVHLACIQDDAQGQPLAVLWEHEQDRSIIGGDDWGAVAAKGFDDPEMFGAYYRTLKWNCVTATDPSLLQAPFRAGIRIDAYQLEPLRKALRLPRVNLFIADDVGLGKTIEAGLIARELLLRKRIDTIVVTCPPAMLLQWQEELEARFGLSFVILDRAFIAAMRRERGFSVNPWTTHSRFLISHRLLIDEAYAAGLRDWLGDFRPRSMLIIDEAHHAAPASGARYAIDSQITRTMRDVAPRFEHRLFLSATPHNGHSNSFSSLLELLDPQRFCRGVPVRAGQLDEVMVRRLKDDIRAIEGGFPCRVVAQIDIDGLPETAPELLLARLLDEYRTLREGLLKERTRAQQAAAALVIIGLQQRLLSSIEAFARTLKVHKRGLEKALEGAAPSLDLDGRAVERLERALAAETDADEEAVSDTEALESAGDEALSEATLAAIAGLGGESAGALRAQLAFVERLEEIADRWRSLPDERVKKLLAWIDENMCPGLSSAREGAPRQWNGRRLLIFTEYEATRRYLQGLLEHAVATTDRGESRIRIFTGSTPPHIREEIKHAFNADPDEEPLRILIATDAAREGLNLQRHCYDLFHFDLPWNPSRIEQRNGRIDRKLQPAAEVFCRYFFYVQRPEDRVLQALVRKTETIRTELGSLAQVLEGRLAETLKGGIRRRDVEATRQKIESAELDGRRATVDRELEETRERQDAIKDRIDRLRNQLARSRNAIGVDAGQLRRTISLALRLNGAPGLERTDEDRLDRPVETFRFPGDSRSLAADPRWSGTLDTLRERKERGEDLGQWRRRAAIRPVTFEDPGALGDKAVHLHLEHRVVQRLLGRFSAQGLIHHDLSRACLAVAPDALPRVALLGRLAIYGPGAARLHEEIVPITARWIEPTRRQGPLRPYAREAETVTLTVLEAAFDEAHKHRVPDEVARRLRENAAIDIADLMPHLKARGEAARVDAEKALDERARRESAAMRKLLEDQKKRIAAALGQDDRQFTLNFDEAERRQRQAERSAWDRRMAKLDRELGDEPRRIEEGYETRAWRLEPVGLVYLWPVTG